MQTAAEQDHADVVAWLHEQGCPLIPIEVAHAAVESNNVCILQYVIDTGAVFTADELTELLDATGTQKKAKCCNMAA